MVSDTNWSFTLMNRKATFDMFNFLASQHRELPDVTGPFEEEDDDFPLKSSRQDRKSAILIQFQPHRRGTFWFFLKKNKQKTIIWHISHPCSSYISVLGCNRRATSSELPMAMRFRHLEKISKEAVGVYRYQPAIRLCNCPN